MSAEDYSHSNLERPSADEVSADTLDLSSANPPAANEKNRVYLHDGDLPPTANHGGCDIVEHRELARRLSLSWVTAPSTIATMPLDQSTFPYLDSRILALLNAVLLRDTAIPYLVHHRCSRHRPKGPDAQ